MRENDTKVITAMRRESPVYKGLQRFSALEVIRFFAMFSDFSFDGSSTYWQGGDKPFDTPETLSKGKM